METYHPPKEVEEKEDNSELPEQEVISETWLREKIDSLMPLIKVVLKISKLNNLFHFQQENRNEYLKIFQYKLYVQAKPTYPLFY